jgi:hypothetical protein
MKKMIFILILALILTTSLVKNSTKEIEDKIFSLDESIRTLKIVSEDLMLEYNYLSSPEKLMQQQNQYFENDLVKLDIMKVKKIIINNDLVKITDFIDKIKVNE